MSQAISSTVERKQELLEDMQSLLEQRKILKARSSLKDFCEYVIKDEKSGNKITLADLQMSWINHIGFCRNHGINALILAPMAAGKCVAPDTLFNTRFGFKRAKELTQGQEVLSFDKNSREPVWTKIIAVEPQEFKDMYLIKLDSGKTITCTFDHKMLCSTYGSPEWVTAEDLIENDYVIAPANWALDEPSADYYAYGLTYLTNKPLRYDLERLLNYAKLFDLDLDRAILERDGIIKMQSLGYDQTSFNRNGICSFMGGVFDASGCYNPSLKMYEVVHPTKDELLKLQILLQAIGIKSKVVRRVKPKGVEYSLLVSKDYTGNFQDKISCLIVEARKHLHCRRSDETNYFLEKVIDVKNLGADESIGIQTENSVHVTNGLVSHNTQIVGVALPLYLLGKDPSCRIKMVCLSDDAAKERLGSIQSYINDDEDYHKVFPNVKRDKNKEWSKHNISIERSATKSAKDPSVSAKGVIANGIGGRCDILLVDDIFDQRTAIAQPATREQINATYRIVWLSRIDKGGMAVVICTRWHERDLAGEVLNDPAMRDQYGILIQSINSDFTGIDIKVIVPDKLKEEYQKAMAGFAQV